MESRTYTVGELARLAEVTVRTLHHFEDTGLLQPERAANGYRLYGHDDVVRLQQILLLRSCGLTLADIRSALEKNAFDYRAALERHLATLRAQQQELDKLVETVEKTIASLEGRCTMTDKERFEGMKAAHISENEKRFGAEARATYGDAAVDAANARVASLTEEAWADKEALEGAIIDALENAMAEGDPEGDAAQKLCAMHARWLQLHWGEGAYSREAHAALAEAYVADPRFTAYYDERAGEGATRFLRDALKAWCSRECG